MKTETALLSMSLFIILLCGCTSSPTEGTSATEVAEPAPSNTVEIDPTSTPVTDRPVTAMLPSGVLSMGGGTSGVRLTTVEGIMIDEMQFRGFTLPVLKPSTPNHFHFGGITDQGVIQTPCIFYTAVIYDKHISYHASKSPIINLQEIKGLINLVGPPQLPLVVFSTYDPENLSFFNHNRFSVPSEDESQPTSVPPTVDSWLFTANEDSLPESELIFSYADENGFAIYPLLVEMEGETLKEVWYTLSYEAMHGGGPIIYSGQRGLFILDVETEQVQEVLSKDSPFLAISTSQAWMAYQNPEGGENGSVVIQEINSGGLLEIAILPDTNPTGIGNARFSPTDEYLAWQEHYFGEDQIEIRFRFASTLDGSLQKFESSELISATEDPDVYIIRLAGWIDDQRLLLEATTQDKTDLYLFDLADLSLKYFAPGRFVGFTYP